MKTEQYQIQAKPSVYTVGDVGPEIVTPAKLMGKAEAERYRRMWEDPSVMHVEKRAERLCNESGGDWGKKNTKREYWRKKAAEQIAAEIAAIPPIIPAYWQGFATATGLAVVGYVLQAVMA